jgi:hypothetical protein
VILLIAALALQTVSSPASAVPSGTGFGALTPARILETRTGMSTVDGQSNSIGIRAAGAVTEIPVAGRAGVPLSAVAVSLNVTVTNPAAAGFVTVWPCGSPQPTASNLNYVSGQTVPNAVLSKLGDGGKICVISQQATDLIVDVNGYFAADSGFGALTPARLLETRTGMSTVDGHLDGIGTRTAGAVTEVPVAGRAGVPNSAVAASLNVTVTNPAAAGFVTVWPCGSPQPTASNLNYVTGQTVPNAVLSKLGDGGKICIVSQQATDLIVDVNGYFAADSGFGLLVPARILETRRGMSTADGQRSEIGTRAAGEVTDVPVAGRAGVPLSAVAASLNVTVTNPAAAGFVTVWPCGSPQPTASNLNYVAGQTIPNAVLSKLGDGGKVCIVSQQATDIIVDVNGYFTSPVVTTQSPSTERPGTVNTRFGNAGYIKLPGNEVQAYVTGLSLAGSGMTFAILNVSTGDPAHNQSNGFRVIRFDSNGTIDRSFGADGTLEINFNTAFAFSDGVVAAPDGSALLAMDLGDSPFGPKHAAVTRITTAGTIDRSFGSNGLVTVASPYQPGDCDFDSTSTPVVLADGSFLTSIHRLVGCGVMRVSA